MCRPQCLHVLRGDEAENSAAHCKATIGETQPPIGGYPGGMAEVPWLTNKEAAAYLKVSVHTLGVWRGRGILTAHTTPGGRRLRYDPRDLDELMQVAPKPKEVPPRQIGREKAREMAQKAKREREKRRKRQKVLEDLFEQQQGQIFLLDAQRRLANERGTRKRA